MVNFLDSNPVFSMAANRFLSLCENCMYILHPFPLTVDHPLYLSVNEVIYNADNNVVNNISNFSACVYRKDALKVIPEKLFEYNVYDWHINVAVSRYGPVAYFPDLFSVYRVNKNSTWNRLTEREKLKSLLAGIDILEQFFPEYKERYALVRHGSFIRKCYRFLKRTLKSLLPL